MKNKMRFPLVVLRSYDFFKAFNLNEMVSIFIGTIGVLLLDKICDRIYFAINKKKRYCLKNNLDT